MSGSTITATPAPPSVVTCTRCGRPFLAPTDQPSAVIECPCCGAHTRRDSLLALPPDVPPRVGRASNAWPVVGAVVLALGVVGAVGYGFRRLLPATRPANTPAAPSDAAPSDPQRIQESVLQEARTAAERALGAADWTAARPLLLDADRVAPTMQKYHTLHPWIPMTLVGPHEGTLTSSSATRTARLSVRSDRGSLLTLHLQDTPTGWKLDWERLINARQFAWEMFHQERPTTPVFLHVLALRGSADPACFASAGLTPETGLAVRLDGPRPGLPTLAIVPKASDLGRLFQRDLTWQQPRPYRCHLRMANPDQVPPRVEITSFSGEGWDEGWQVIGDRR